MNQTELFDVLIDLNCYEGEPQVTVDVRSDHTIVIQEFDAMTCGGKVVKHTNLKGEIESFVYEHPKCSFDEDLPDIDLSDCLDEIPDFITATPDIIIKLIEDEA